MERGSKTAVRVAAPVPAPVPVHRTAIPGAVQRAALTVSSASDASEREAVATAARVVRMPDPAPAARSAWRSPHVARFSGAVGRAANPHSTPATPAAPQVTAEVAAGISTGMGGGGPLPDGVRRYMEPRFHADFSRVRIHTDAPAAALSRRLNARAFTVGQHVFFGRDAFRPDQDDGRALIAHELTHTIQQGAVVQRSAEPAVGERTDTHVQRLGIDDALAYFARHAELIPGFRLLTLVLGVNPITMSRVERSAANLLRALVELLPGGALIVQALDGYGLFDRAGTWAEAQLRAVGTSGGQLKDAIGRFLDSLSWRDIFDLGGVWGRAKRIVSEPIDRITGLARGMVAGILGFIREAVLRPLAGLVEGTAGYALLKGVLGFDPVTGDAVPRDAATLIGGFMRLIGQEEIWQNIQRTNALPRAWAWFQGALGALLGFVRQIPALFVRTFALLEIADLVLVPRAFAKVASVFADFVGGFARWAGEAMWTLLEILFDAVAPGVMPYLRRAAGALRTILRQPIAFVGNLVRAGKLGFSQFAANIGAHLRTSLLGWLTGALGGTGIYLPRSFHLREIVQLVLSVLGLTWQQLRPRLARAIGDTPLRVLEESFDIVVALRRDGPAAAWERIAEHLSNLQEMVVGQITTFVTETIVRRAAVQLVALLTPAGAVIQAIVAAYNTIMFFVERLRQIAQVAAAFIDSIAAIAAGVIAAAANRVEQTLGGLLTLAISFLARFLGLGRVGDAIAALIGRLRAPIDRALDKVIAWIVTTARRLGRLAVATGRRLFNWAFARRSFRDEEGRAHSLFVDASGAVPTLKIASDPVPAHAFLTWYLQHRGEAFRRDNQAKIGPLEAAIRAAQETVARIAAQPQSADAAAPDPLQRQLLEQNVAVTQLLTALIGSDASFSKAREKYLLEGASGTYGSIPKPRGDELTADHQPQAAVLEAAADLDYFTEGGEMVRRAARRAHQGFAINLHRNRHESGRTYGAKGKRTKQGFLAAVGAVVRRKPRAEQRRAVVAVIKEELRADVASMRSVVGSGYRSPVWKDVMETGGTMKEREQLVDEIRGRIAAGESQIASQNLDALED